MKTVEIPGGTAEFREEHELRTRDKRLLEVTQAAAAAAYVKLKATGFESGTFGVSELAKAGLSESEVASIFRVRDGKIVAALASWSLPDPLPTLDTLGDVSPAVYDALAEATDPVTVSSVDFEPHPDTPDFEYSPTSPSDGSATV